VTEREAHLVELVDADGTPRGAATVADAHQPPGDLHRAFSVVLTDPKGRLLLQRRATVKTRFAGRWANACCGHPAPGVTPANAATVRLREELGLDTDASPIELRDVGVYVYQASDSASGRVEHEYDHVLVGALPPGATFDPDPTEVDELRWVSFNGLCDEIAKAPDAYAPWLSGVVSTLPDAVVATFGN
jgi:isopentenyl-diphosphate delta-isomerase